MTARRTPPKAGPMCAVTIGYRVYLLPSDKGMKLVELLQHAVEAERKFDSAAGAYLYQVDEPPTVEFKSVQAKQIRMPEGIVEPFPTPAGAAALPVATRPRLLR